MAITDHFRKVGSQKFLVRYIRSPWRKLSRWLNARMPKRLFTRSLLIIIVPMVLLQSIVAFVFMERHWQSVTQRLSKAVISEIAAVVDIIESYPQDTEYATIRRIARENLNLNIALLPPNPLPPPNAKPFFNILDGILSREISAQINRPFWLDTVGDSGLLEIRIRLPDNVLRVYVKRNQAYASNSHIFLIWMVASSLVLILIAILFLRNQIRPIQQLSDAAESFGKGQPMPEGFRPRGAQEVRRAGRAFLEMRERIERQVEQRTAMLAGVSHDLRTILTRFKLQLTFIGKSAEVEALQDDINDMQSMLEGYMDFARGEGGEQASQIDLQSVFDRLQIDAELAEKQLETSCDGSTIITVRPGAFSRLMSNLVGNALRYGKTVRVHAEHHDKWLTIHVDDDGPGIPEEKREEVFKPFFRLDEARNLDDSGTGLGLAIARDIALVHGGSVTLEDSPLGGLRATVKLPV